MSSCPIVRLNLNVCCLESVDFVEEYSHDGIIPSSITFKPFYRSFWKNKFNIISD